MDIVHRAVQGVELCTSLATFLKFPLKTTEDVVESKAALARAAPAHRRERVDRLLDAPPHHQRWLVCRRAETRTGDHLSIAGRGASPALARQAHKFAPRFQE